jgi:hypothetical protein
VTESPLILAMMVSPKNASAKYSGDRNASATLAISGASSVRRTTLVAPPTNDATVAIPMALPAWPCFASGKPSNTVAAALGVPGVRMSIAGIDPAYSAPP